MGANWKGKAFFSKWGQWLYATFMEKGNFIKYVVVHVDLILACKI